MLGSLNASFAMLSSAYGPDPTTTGLIRGRLVTIGDVGKETVSALKGQPLLLVIVILNVLMLAMVGYAVKAAQDYNHVIIAKLIEKCGPQ